MAQGQEANTGAGAANGQAAPKKRTRKAGPRNVKPTFLLISYTDENGEPVALDAERLMVQGTKDPTELLKILTGPKGAEGRVVKTLQIQEAAQAPQAPAA